jgi:archaellum component FlaF (FlaF/FlaG flagellin family)
MGFSVTIASTIVLIGLVVLFGSLSAVLVYSLNTLSDATREYVSRERDKLDVKLGLEIQTISADSCEISVKNSGTKAIFLQSQENFQWNSIVISYQNNSNWLSYVIENYTVLEIRILDTSPLILFDPASHSFINPGEEAIISFDLTEDAPAIPTKAPVVVVFASHYGVTAQAEGAR